jgi:hypothetical protein
MARNVPDPKPRNIMFDNSLAHLYFSCRRGVDAVLGQVDQVQQRVPAGSVEDACAWSEGLFEFFMGADFLCQPGTQQFLVLNDLPIIASAALINSGTDGGKKGLCLSLALGITVYGKGALTVAPSGTLRTPPPIFYHLHTQEAASPGARLIRWCNRIPLVSSLTLYRHRRVAPCQNVTECL